MGNSGAGRLKIDLCNEGTHPSGENTTRCTPPRGAAGGRKGRGQKRSHFSRSPAKICRNVFRNHGEQNGTWESATIGGDLRGEGGDTATFLRSPESGAKFSVRFVGTGQATAHAGERSCSVFLQNMSVIYEETCRDKKLLINNLFSRNIKYFSIFLSPGGAFELYSCP